MFSSGAILEYLDQSTTYQDAILLLLNLCFLLYFFPHDYWQNPLIKRLLLARVGRGLLN